jgi:hypothetical protein
MHCVGGAGLLLPAPAYLVGSFIGTKTNIPVYAENLIFGWNVMSHLFLHVAQQAAGWTYNIFHRQFGYGVVDFD